MTDTYDTLIVWNVSGVVDFDHYNIYRYNDGTDEWDLIGAPKAPAWTDKLLPAGSYYYCVSAVDKNGNESDVSDYIEKDLPELAAPSMPTGLVAERNTDRTSITLTWYPNLPAERVKGYVIYRSLNAGSTYQIIDTTSNNKYTDSSFPAPSQAYSGQNAKYKIQAYNADMSASAATSATTALEVALIEGLRTILDYLSLNVYWDNPSPERVAISYVTIFYKTVAAPTWTVAGSVYAPSSQIRIEGPLVEGTTYLIGYTVNSNSTTYIRDLKIAVTIPTYEHDATLPTVPWQLKCSYDPDTDIGYINWQRDAVDDDLLYYEVQISGSTATWYKLHGTSKDSNYTLRNTSKYLIAGYSGVLVRIRGVDRSGNVSSTWASGVIYIRPLFEGFTAIFDDRLKGTINPALVGTYTAVEVAVFDLQWMDMGRKLREFKRYILFETEKRGMGGEPNFYYDETEIRAVSTTNSLRVNVFRAGGLGGTSSPYRAPLKVAYAIGVEDGQGNVFYGEDYLDIIFEWDWPPT